MNAGTFQILVGIDFSDSSAGAMYHALSLAERLGAVLHLCHVTPYDSNLAVNSDLGLNIPAEFKEAREARVKLERIRAMLGAKVNVELHLRMGDAVRSLVALARELNIGMIVVGSHGYGPIRRVLLGSVSAELTRRAPVPVLVVPAPGREEALNVSPDAPSEVILPSVGTGPDETLDTSRTNDSNSGSVNLSPAGVSGYDVNPELRVRY